MKFLKGLLVTFLILVIVGGVSYIGYTSLFMNHTGNNAAASQAQGSSNNNSDSSNKTDSQGQRDAAAMQNAGANAIISQAATTLKSKEMLEKSIASLKDALKFATLDMQGMGTTYDLNKMEQLHNGLFKMSYGMALLDQLNNDLVSQAENSNANIGNPTAYYSNQYNQAVVNKTKLNQALSNINDAANLININPYIAANGFVYDKDRMGQIHQSLAKLAEGIASLNLFNDNLTRQTIFLSNAAQSYISNAGSVNTNNASTNTNHSAMTSSLFGGIFDSVSVSSIVNLILIIFVAVLILGIFGFIFNLAKSSSQVKEV